MFALNDAGFSVLDYASFSGLLWLIREIMAKGADINDYKNGISPLHFAARGGHTDVIRFFFRRGADIRDINILFADACEGGLLWFVQELFEKGACVKTANELGETPLHRAAAGINTVSVAQFLVENNADIDAVITRGDEEGATPLHRAVRSGNLQVVHLLVKQGADMNRNARHLGSPLLFAASCNQHKIITFLIKSGADINIVIGDRISPDTDDFSYVDKTLLFWAIIGKYHQIATQLISSGIDVHRADNYGKTPLHYAAHYGRDSIIPPLLAAGAKLDARDSVNGHTPLMYAVKEKKEETAFLLIGAGADIFLKDKEMNTLLHLASASGLVKIVSHLLDQGEKIDAAAKSGETPLHYALTHGQEKTAAMLMRRGASIGIQDAAGDFPLHIAAGINGDLVQIILDRGDAVDRKNRKGLTPLHCSACRDRPDAAFVLLTKSASIDAQDDEGRTPLYIAAERGHFEVVQLLVSHRADISIRTGGYETLSPLEIAKQNRHTRIVHFLARYAGKSEEELENEQKENRILLYFEAIEKAELFKIKHYISHFRININTRDSTGRTALHRAVEKKDVRMIGFLLRSGAKTKEKDSSGKTPVELCGAEDGELRNLLMNPPRLKPDVNKLIRLLKQRPSEKRNHDLVALFSHDRLLGFALTQTEFDKLRRIRFPGLRDLIPEIKKLREKELFPGMECMHCGRDTVIRLPGKIITGDFVSPNTGAGKGSLYNCASCGYEFHEHD